MYNTVANPGIIDPPSIEKLTEILKGFHPEDIVTRITLSKHMYDNLRESLTLAEKDKWGRTDVVVSGWMMDDITMVNYADGSVQFFNLEDGTESERAEGANPYLRLGPSPMTPMRKKYPHWPWLDAVVE